VVLLSGEPGIGKSRLTAALLEGVAVEPHTRRRYFCSPQHTDSAFYSIISQMERAAGLTHEDTAEAKLDKLNTLLAQSFTPRQDAALFWRNVVTAERSTLSNSQTCSTAEAAKNIWKRRLRKCVRSGDLMGFLGAAVTPVLSSDLGRHLLGELRELLGLRGHRLELLACMRGRQLNELRRGLHPQQFISVVKGGVGIGTGDLDDLAVVVCGAIGGRRIGALEEDRCFLGGPLDLS
jgi:predicted ATPase